jgi:hypothetical protein
MNQKFGANSTTDEVLSGINLAGKRMLVTGVSAGLGVETARALGIWGRPKRRRRKYERRPPQVAVLSSWWNSTWPT